MTDLSGRAYGRLPQAFQYRKELVAGCACKPEPWSEAELARHEAYAMIEAEAAKEARAVAAAEEQGAADGAAVTETAALPAEIVAGQSPQATTLRSPAHTKARAQASGVQSSSWSPAPPPEYLPFRTP